jgi:hypothetical protein
MAHVLCYKYKRLARHAQVNGFTQIFVVPMQLLFLPVWLALLHPVHVSVTDIVYDAQEQELEITMRLFTDDLELSLQNAHNQPGLNVLHPGKEAATALLLSDYILKRFSVVVDGKKVGLRLLGFEPEADVIVCYIQAADVKRWRSIEVVNTVIMETYADQSNLVHLTFQGKVRSYRLSQKQPSCRFLKTEF